MTFKEIFNKIKEENKKSKEENVIDNINNNSPDKLLFNKKIKESLFESNIKFEIFNEKETKNFYTVKKGDSLKSISKLFYDNENKWIMLHLANYDKIKNPLNLQENIKIYIPKEGEFNNYYSEYDNEYNYIVQENDDIKKISEKIFGTGKLYKKLIDWNFFKKPDDIYPSKVLYGLKYKSYYYQIDNINKNYFDIKDNYKSILIKFIIRLCKKYNLSPLPVLLISNVEDEFLKSENVNITSDYWGILQLSEKKYSNYFPNVVFSIEENINLGLRFIREIKSQAKNWPRTIIDYFLIEGIGIGKPEYQKDKVKKALVLIENLLKKMDNMNIKELEKKYPDLNDKNNISFDFLRKEIIDYAKFIELKYF